MIIEREREICDRLRRFRELLQIPRTKFALTVGINSERLYTYESGKAQIRYDTFSAVQKHFSLNPVWLATGQEGPRLEGFSDEKFRHLVKPRELFSSVYDRLLNLYLTADRINKEGNEHLLTVAAIYSDPKTLRRLRMARECAGVSLAMLAANLTAAFRQSITEKQIRRIESGKERANLRMMIAWRYEARISEEWAKTGSGEMFTIPNWQSADYLPRIKQAREAAGLSYDILAERLAQFSTVRLTGEQMEQIEAGKIILMQSVELALPAALGVPKEQLFPGGHAEPDRNKISLRDTLVKTRQAMNALEERFAELEKAIAGKPNQD